jgi:4'-phosphopantetheinyl transferase EntD
VIEVLLPPGVVAAEAFADRPGEAGHPEEAELISGAVEGRRREFITGRRCAREALALLGEKPVPIGAGERRQPLWPAGIVGSITHCAGYRAAAVGRADDVAAIGIDAEPDAPLPEGVRDVVMSEAEGALLSGEHADRVLFCAKEAIYKAWFPLTRRWLGFEECHLTIDPDARTFVGRLLVDGERVDGGTPLTELSGRYLRANGLILAVVSVPAGSPRPGSV